MRREPGLEARFLIPDLQTLIKVKGSQSAAARAVGMSEGWLRGILTGRRTHISFDTAQKVGEAVRGSRGLAEEWAKRDHARQVKREYERTREKTRTRPGDREEATHDRHVCSHCDSHLDTAHGLWLHSRSQHKDQPSQGKNQWSAFRVRS